MALVTTATIAPSTPRARRANPVNVTKGRLAESAGGAEAGFTGTVDAAAGLAGGDGIVMGAIGVADGSAVEGGVMVGRAVFEATAVGVLLGAGVGEAVGNTTVGVETTTFGGMVFGAVTAARVERAVG